MRAEPLSAALGAELHDVDLANLDEESAAALRAALLEYKVVGIRDQHLDDDQHVALASWLGVGTAARTPPAAPCRRTESESR